MPEEAPRPRRENPKSRAEPLSLEAFLEAQFESFRGGPTMADILARADARRARGTGVSRELIVRIQRELRDETA